MTCVWHNLPWAISLGMTNAVYLCKPQVEFFKRQRLFLLHHLPTFEQFCCLQGYPGKYEIAKKHVALTDWERVFCGMFVCVSVCVPLQEGALWFLCSKEQLSLEVANQSLSLQEEEVGEVVVGWDMPSLPRILIVQDDPHSCCTPNVNTDSSIHHKTPFCRTCPKYSNDLVPAAGTALRFSQTVVFKNEEVEMARRQGLWGEKNLISGFWEEGRRVTRVSYPTKLPPCFNFSFSPKLIGFDGTQGKPLFFKVKFLNHYCICFTACRWP